jgi:hypothetical protein
MRNNVPHGKGYRTKLTFWARSFDWRTETEPKLVVIAKRLDVDGPSVLVAHASAVFIPSNGRVSTASTVAPAMMTLIDMPSAGKSPLTTAVTHCPLPCPLSHRRVYKTTCHYDGAAKWVA